MIGSLMYLSVNTRPDIAYAVSNLAKFSSDQTRCTAGWHLKCVLCYFKGTVGWNSIQETRIWEMCHWFLGCGLG